MGRYSVFFSLLFITGGILAALLAGGGFAATQSVYALNTTNTTITVLDTTGFLSADVLHPAYIQMDDEVMTYTGLTTVPPYTFTGVSRGQTDPQSRIQSTAATHSIDTYVKTLDVKALDAFIGYSITSTGATFGTLDALIFLKNFFLLAPKMILFDYPWFTGVAVLFRYILLAFSIGFVVSLAIALVSLGFSIFRQ